jgi:nuclear transport factor 2 (NTF2) superfamily protein
MFLASAIQVTNYNQSVNKRVVAEMTWKSQEGAPIASLFSEANFFKNGGKCGVERGEIVERLAHQFVRHSRLLGLCYCFGGR